MSYLALARKWRPRSFEDVLGQDHVVRALSHALDGDRLHPAILLTGTRGVGKTTLARIVAKGLNCETGVTASPCGECGACAEIVEGRFVDLLEIDAASNTGVDNVRELIDNSQYAPGRGRYKVYLIDEVHMLSKSAFNALLKTLEEPPPHVKFILATTDPQKLPVTVLSRCLQFNLKRLPARIIREQLEQVLSNEKIACESGAMIELARAADGSMRDGLSLLDQAIAFSGGGKIERAPIEDMLGTAGRHGLCNLLKAVAAQDGKALVNGIAELDQRSPDYFALLNDLCAFLQRIAVLQAVPDVRSDEDEDELLELAGQMPAEDVQLCYQIAVGGRRDLPWAPEPRAGFEMTLLRMLLFRPDDAAPPASRSQGSNKASRPPVKAASAAASSQAKDLPWRELIEALDLDKGARQLARECVWVSHEKETVRLQLDPSAKFLLKDSAKKNIEAGLRAQFSDKTSLKIELKAPMADAPAQESRREAEAAQKALTDKIRTDPVVTAFQDQFGATLRPDSIQTHSEKRDSAR